MYQEIQNRRHNFHTTPFSSSDTDCDQQGINHVETTRSSNRFHNTYPYEYSNSILNASNTPTSNLKTPLHAKGTIYKGNLLSFIMIAQTIIQITLATLETLDEIKSIFKAWMESTENALQISGQNAIHITFSKLTGFSTFKSQ